MVRQVRPEPYHFLISKKNCIEKFSLQIKIIGNCVISYAKLQNVLLCLSIVGTC